VIIAAETPYEHTGNVLQFLAYLKAGIVEDVPGTVVAARARLTRLYDQVRDQPEAAFAPESVSCAIGALDRGDFEECATWVKVVRQQLAIINEADRSDRRVLEENHAGA